MQFDIARGAIPQQFIEHNVRYLGLHRAQAEKLADLLSILMLERSHFIYKMHHKLHNNGRAEHAALNPPKHSLLGGPSLSGEGLEGLGYNLGRGWRYRTREDVEANDGRLNGSDSLDCTQRALD
jgi:hypothetical protein